MHALKDAFSKFQKGKKQETSASSYTSLDQRDLYRYRRQYGVNLGSWFVLEKWISLYPFRDAAPPSSSDYDVARGSNAKRNLEQHWDNWITDDDWKWIAERGINSVRIPIGYYHLYSVDQNVVKGTPFEDFGHVFEGAWPRIFRAIEKASKYEIGVLIGNVEKLASQAAPSNHFDLDLHSAPGKQNGDAHSGINGPVEFFKKSNLEHTISVLKLLATALAHIPNVVGLELVNEPRNDNVLYSWYQKALNTIRTTIGPDLPLYIGDAWGTYQYATLIEGREDFVILDHHLYRCFTSQDQRFSGEEHAAALPPKFLIDCFRKTHGNLVVGEFSAALNPNSMRSPEAGEQDRQRRVFARAELAAFQKYCGGWWFWTYKKDGWDAGWNFRDTIRAEIMPDWVGFRRSQMKLDDERSRDSECAIALGQHESYWAHSKSGHKYEHWRFEMGFKRGWGDAFLFFSHVPDSPMELPVSELGFLGQWLKRRVTEHAVSHGKSKNIWEYEHGFEQGVQAASKFAGGK